MLSNLETEKSKLLQIVMVGQPNLRDKLAAPELEQLRQRITVSYHLPPLDIDETANYINHRLRRAALGAPLEFPREATDVIHARSRGVPRIINVICDAALVFGYAEERRVFDAPLIQEVLAELETTGVLPTSGGPTISQHAAVQVPAAAVATAPPAAPTPVPAAAPAAMPARASVGAATGVAFAPPPPINTRGTSVALEEREARIRQRELELAEQRRVLAEEYRLLRAQRQSPPDPAQVVTAENGRVRLQARSAGMRLDTPREGFWPRLKRIMLGVPTS
jgi:hypothetical protein